MTATASRARDKTVLVYGYGNPGRLDDGLGPAVAEAIDTRALPGVATDANYQLSVEDAAAVAEHDVVVFADAAERGPEPFFFCRIAPVKQTSFSSHSVRPEAVLGLARDLMNGATEGWVLGIRGYEFNEFGEGLSPAATRNLTEAVTFLDETLRRGDFRERNPDPDGHLWGRIVHTEEEGT